MTRDQALQKIKKCLALAASSNPHEAAAAMRQAQKLMQDHGLDEADVSLADVSEVVQDGRNVPMVRWETGLAKIVADAFGCLTHTGVRLSLKGGATHRRVRAFTFIGVGASAEIAGYAFAVLSRQCAKDRRAFIGKQPANCKPKTKVARGDAFAEGWVCGVHEKLGQFAGKPEHAALLNSYQAKKYPNLADATPKDRSVGKNVRGNEVSQGFKAGQNAELNHAVGGAAARPALAG